MFYVKYKTFLLKYHINSNDKNKNRQLANEWQYEKTNRLNNRKIIF